LVKLYLLWKGLVTFWIDCGRTLIGLESVAAFGVDLVRGAKTLELIKEHGIPAGKTLFAGVVDGRNIWANDLAASVAIVEDLQSKLGAENVVVSTSCSLLHSAVDLKNETKLDAELKSWMAFAAQKLHEVVALANAASGKKDEEFFSSNAAAQESRRNSPRVHNKAVKEAVSTLSLPISSCNEFSHEVRAEFKYRVTVFGASSLAM
jgi:5-methyltetrahydropteroyltriglutamate--homocysteine methyltransferase